uniref:Uncharacterized protein n=1 Tax=Arundo donax TaxID=35708 RepID=A0A0A9FC99_ARUDO
MIKQILAYICSAPGVLSRNRA